MAMTTSNMTLHNVRIAVHVDDGYRAPRWENLDVQIPACEGAATDAIDDTWGVGDWSHAMVLFPDGDVLEVEGFMMTVPE